jgi:septal ring factor EnvC (AmiA/AmiB activator)
LFSQDNRSAKDVAILSDHKLTCSRSAFAKHHIVNAAALENVESVEQVIKDLAGLKKKNAVLEDELFELRERYFNMSLQFAEVEADREQLVMTIRTLRGNKKLLPFRSVNF